MLSVVQYPIPVGHAAALAGELCDCASSSFGTTPRRRLGHGFFDGAEFFDLVIEGTVEGRVELPNNQLTVGANGVVRAEIQAKCVVVVGKVTGNIQGSERIEIQATGVVDGDVSAPRLVVAEGAVLNGAIEMGGKSASSVHAPPPQAIGDAKAG